MPRLYHPQYERKTDRRTRLQFAPARLDGRTVAAAEVADDTVAADLIARGWRVWPGTESKPAQEATLPEDLTVLTVPQIRELAAQHGVDLGPRGTKADLIDALQAAVAPAKDPPQDPPA
jgi:hypothetical protein